MNPNPCIASYKYFHVEELPLTQGCKLHRYRVVSRGGANLGTIYYLGAWCEFIFESAANTVWSPGCLRNIQDAIRKITKAEKEK